jgi:8-oxo-dGTP diphosphatase
MLAEEDHLLLVKRRHDPARGCWALPGGFLDSGEDPREAALREMREETALDVEITELVDVWSEPPSLGGATLVIAFRATRTSGELRASDDAVDAAFFHLDALPELAFRSTLQAIDILRNLR